MDLSQVRKTLRLLGFFYYVEDDRGQTVDFRAGHVSSAPFVLLSMNKQSCTLSGAYAELFERLAPVVARYVGETDEVVMLPPTQRQAWLATLADEAGLTASDLRAVTSNLSL